MYWDALRIATGQGGATCPSSPFWQMPTFYPRRGRTWRPRAQDVQAGLQCLALGPSQAPDGKPRTMPFYRHKGTHDNSVTHLPLNLLVKGRTAAQHMYLRRQAFLSPRVPQHRLCSDPNAGSKTVMASFHEHHLCFQTIPENIVLKSALHSTSETQKTESVSIRRQCPLVCRHGWENRRPVALGQMLGKIISSEKQRELPESALDPTDRCSLQSHGPLHHQPCRDVQAT